MRPSAHRRVAGLLVAIGSLFLLVHPAAAASGVSVDLGRIEITEQLQPGGSYNLPTIGVRNPGTERTSYVMVASPVQDPELGSPKDGWFRFEPASVTLGPGEVQRVRIRLVLPTDAEPGDYLVLVGAQIAAEGGGARVGAAAAARTTFTIKPASDLEALGIALGQLFSDLLPWSAIVPAAFAGSLALWYVRRRFTFRIGIARR
jgi:hypothetical protein